MRLVISASVRSYKMEYTVITDIRGVEHILIDHGNDQFTSMPKSVWDELEAAKEAQSL